ncbi:hypothetical protein GGS20DRAFT_221694 [Poronia punctata]|nr:hypothetical protein GGS20DRAFT_221694 [Poronia punctata]
MSRAKITTFVGLVDSEDDLDISTAKGSKAAKKMPPAKKTRGATAGRPTKPSQTKQAAARSALTEKASNIAEKPGQGKGTKRPASDDIEEDQDSTEVTETSRTGRGRPRANKAPKVAEEEDELSQIQIEPVAPTRGRRGRKPKANVEVEVPETQPQEMDFKEIPETQQPVDMADTSTEPVEQTKALPRMDLPPIPTPRRHQSRVLSSPSRKTTSTSESEQSDSALRRRLGELTRKYDNLEAKYRDLREIAVQEAERNFDRLQKQSEERANTDKQLIATLKAKLAADSELAKDVERLRKQLEDSQNKVDELQGKLEGAQSSLTESKTEIKTLSTKLTAARSAEPAPVKVPGSAMKNVHGNNRHQPGGAEAAAQLAQKKELLQKKENLYGDLTGLLVCGVKREKDEEVFDCVQTGRNGTLHFKLAAGTEGDSDQFADEQFMYKPQLDSDRDQELIDLLPDYLVEEITFPRLHAAKFYSRVVKALNESPE